MGRRIHRIKMPKTQQAKAIFLHPTLADSLIGKVAGFKKAKQTKHHHPPNKTPQNSTGIPMCQKLYSS